MIGIFRARKARGLAPSEGWGRCSPQHLLCVCRTGTTVNHFHYVNLRVARNLTYRLASTGDGLFMLLTNRIIHCTVIEERRQDGERHHESNVEQCKDVDRHECPQPSQSLSIGKTPSRLLELVALFA
jgi:hypothetical protein